MVSVNSKDSDIATVGIFSKKLSIGEVAGAEACFTYHSCHWAL
jgi:hypothetical protein